MPCMGGLWSLSSLLDLYNLTKQSGTTKIDLLEGGYLSVKCIHSQCVRYDRNVTDQYTWHDGQCSHVLALIGTSMHQSVFSCSSIPIQFGFSSFSLSLHFPFTPCSLFVQISFSDLLIDLFDSRRKHYADTTAVRFEPLEADAQSAISMN